MSGFDSFSFEDVSAEESRVIGRLREVFMFFKTYGHLNPVWFHEQVEDLIEMCFDYHIMKTGIMVWLLKLVGVSKYLLIVVLKKCIHDERTLPSEIISKRQLEGLPCFDFLSYYLYHAYQCKLTFGGKWFSGRIPGREQTYFPIPAAVKFRSKETLLTLLRYGFGAIFGNNKISSELPANLQNPRNISISSELQDPRFQNRAICEDRNLPGLSEDVKMVFRMLVLIIDKYYQTKQEALTLENNGLEEEFSVDLREKFHIIWRTIPSPFVRLHEFREAMKVVLNDYDFYCSLYELYFPSMCLGERQPRSLKHLCRCAIREKLRENWQLPDGVKKLGLPPCVCAYLNLEAD